MGTEAGVGEGDRPYHEPRSEESEMRGRRERARSMGPRLSFSLGSFSFMAAEGEPERDVGGRGDAARLEGELFVDERREESLDPEEPCAGWLK